MAIKRVYSAGGIVVKKEGDDIKVLLTQHSGHHGWEFPKGHIEAGENGEVAAIREVEEESGVVAEVLEKAGNCRYFYYDAGPFGGTQGKERVLKKVTYFLMKCVGEGEATTAFEVSGKEWLAVGEVGDKLTYKSVKGLWTSVKDKVEELAAKI